jgi:hypothetical protein
MDLEMLKDSIKEKHISFEDLMSMDFSSIAVLVGEHTADAEKLWNAIHMQENTRLVVESMFNDLATDY